MTRTTFFDQVKKHFHYLLDEYGFSLVHEEVFPSFDNAELVFQSRDCRIRVLRERGEIYVDASPLPPTDYWVDLATIVGFLTQGIDAWQYEYISGDYEFRIERQLAKTADKLRSYIGQICELFRDENFAQRRSELEKFKHQRFVKRWGKYIMKKTVLDQ